MFHSASDSLSPFLIDLAGARGAIVQFRGAYREVLARHDYPALVQQLLGELLAAGALLAGSLKFNGSLILQLQGTGPLKLLVVECTHDLALRAVAQWTGALPEQADLRDLIGSGRFAITLDPKDGGELHQGIVALESGSVSGLLEQYLLRSEQLASRLWLSAEDGVAAGLILQRLPGKLVQDDDAWPRVQLLAQTVRGEELRSLGSEELLARLFADEEVRLFTARRVRFGCHCSQERVAGALRLLGRQDVESLLQERGSVEVHCEFCNRRYEFDHAGIAALFAMENTVGSILH